MNRIFFPSTGPDQWQSLLADPQKHWKPGRSALELAVSWERARGIAGGTGIPDEVRAVLESSDPLRDAELLMAIPEHQVALDNGKAPSQTDLWALLGNHGGLISLAIEAKAGESFGETVSTWLHKDQNNSGRATRLDWLCRELRTSADETTIGTLRYQLFHRTVSALREAVRFRAFTAVVLVQAFPGAECSWDDFASFGSYLGVKVEKGKLVRVPAHAEPQLFLGWVSSPCADDGEIASVLRSKSTGAGDPPKIGEVPIPDDENVDEMPPIYFDTHFISRDGMEGWPADFIIITAYATTGETWTPEQNQAADAALESELLASGRWLRRVTGYSPETNHAEPGWAVEMAWSDGCEIGRRYRQDAIYVVNDDALSVTRCDERRELLPVGSFRDRLTPF